MFFGILILCVGILYLLSMLFPAFNLDFMSIFYAAIAIAGLYHMIRNRKVDIMGSLLVLVGVWFELKQLNYISEQYEDLFWPLVLILIGAMLIISSIRFKKGKQMGIIDQKGYLRYNSIFGGVEEKVKDQDVKGIVVTSIFGGTDLDLRDIKTKEKEIYIEITAIFGGNDLRLPEGYNVVLNSNCIFGGDDNKYDGLYNEKNKTIYINSISIFGGNDIH